MSDLDKLLEFIKSKAYRYFVDREGSEHVDKIYISWNTNPELISLLDVSFDKESQDIRSIEYCNEYVQEDGKKITRIESVDGAKRAISRYMNSKDC